MGFNIAVGQNSSEILQFEDSWLKLKINYYLSYFFLQYHLLHLHCNNSKLFQPIEILHPILETLEIGQSHFIIIEVTKINQEWYKGSKQKKSNFKKHPLGVWLIPYNGKRWILGNLSGSILLQWIWFLCQDWSPQCNPMTISQTLIKVQLPIL